MGLGRHICGCEHMQLVTALPCPVKAVTVPPEGQHDDTLPLTLHDDSGGRQQELMLAIPAIAAAVAEDSMDPGGVARPEPGAIGAAATVCVGGVGGGGGLRPRGISTGKGGREMFRADTGSVPMEGGNATLLGGGKKGLLMVALPFAATLATRHVWA